MAGKTISNFVKNKDMMTSRELIRLLGTKGYRKVTLETDRGESKTFYTYRRGLHINATKNISFHIVPQSQSLGLGRFTVCATKNGESSQLGTDRAELFFPRLFSFLQGETGETEIIDEVIQ
jgi:hypothetical protein